MNIYKIFLIPLIISLFFVVIPRTFAQNTFSLSVTPIISQQFAQLITPFKNLFTPFQQSFIKFAELSSVINNIKKQISDKGLFQEQITLRGIFTFLISDNFKAKKSVEQFFVTNQETKEHYEITFVGERPDVSTGDEIEIHGIAKGKKIVVDNKIASNFKVVRSKPQLPSSQKTSSRKVAVILFNFSSNTQTPYTREQIKEKTFTGTDSVNAYYKENSFNKLELNGSLYPDGDIFGWYTINASTDKCFGYGSGGWINLVDEKAMIDGFIANNYDNIIYLFPYTQSCNFAGSAIISGKQSWINGLYDLHTVAHELGHNFGSHHANRYNCSAPAGNKAFIRTTGCTTVEYGDLFDVMGGGSNHHMNNFHKVQSGEWINETNIKDVTTSGEYTIVPIEYPASPTDIQVLRIQRISGQVINYYYLEFRQPYGFDNFSATDHVVNGVTFRLAKDYSITERSHILDASPNDDDNLFKNSVLKEGKTVRDIEQGITFTTLSVSSSSATIKITFEQPSPCVQSNPTLTVTPQQQSIPLGGQAHYTFTVINNDSLWCYPSLFWTKILNSPSNEWFSHSIFENVLDPGEVATKTIVVTPPSNIAQGIYNFDVRTINPLFSSYYAITSAELEIANQCVFSNPTLTLVPAQQYVNQNESASYNFTLTNNNSFLCSSSNFTITPTLPKTKGKWKQTPQSFTFDLSSGSSTTGTIAITPSSKMPFGTYTITETAINNTHDVYKTTSTVEFIVSDLIPPVVTITKPKTSSTISQTAFVVSAKASDRSGIASLQLFLDGSEIGSCPKKKTCSAKVFTAPLSAGDHIIKAFATDPAPFSNISSSSITVTVIK